MKRAREEVLNITKKIRADHVSAYAAQSTFFMMLSLIPMTLLLMTMVRYTPLTEADVMQAVYEVFPKTIRNTMVSIVAEVYSQSGTTISLSLLVVLWSAGRGVRAITSGLNLIHGSIETRNFLSLRMRAAAYTVLFILAIGLSLLLLGFGNSLGILLIRHIPVLEYTVELIIRLRTVVALLALVVFSVCIYRFLPNYKGGIRSQLPGAIFTALGWTAASFLISIYMDVFRGFSNIYGSLTTIVLIMLWLYFCMYIVLLGGELNVILENLKNPPKIVLDNKSEYDKMEKDMNK